MWIIPKDITTVKAPAMIMQGVNCQGAMGSGVARALYEKWPIVKKEYLETPVEEMKLGIVQAVKVEPDLYVLNCFTQEYFGNDGRKYASAKAIRNCLMYIKFLGIRFKIYNIYAPLIGCGLGGLDWETEVLPEFERFEAENIKFNITICKI